MFKIIKKIGAWLNKISNHHKAWLQSNGYYFYKPLFYGFFGVAFVLLAMVFYLDGFEDRVYISCPKDGPPCNNFILNNIEPCEHYCCNISYLLPGDSCGEPVSWIGTNYSWLIILGFMLMFVINHFIFNRDYDFNKYWGNYK